MLREFCAIMGAFKTQMGSLWCDPSWIDGLMALVIMVLDVSHVDRIFDARDLENIAGVV